MCMLMASCAGSESNEPAGSANDFETISEVNFTRAESDQNVGLNKFGFKFLNEAAIYANSKDLGNFSISPVSASICLSMLANATDDATSATIREALGCSNLEELNTVCRKLKQFLPDGSNGSYISLANSIWHTSELTPDQGFVTRMSDNFNADIKGAEMHTMQTMNDINSWCSRNTNGKIPEVLYDPLEKGTLLFLANAIYFQGGWEKTFDKKDTRNEIFNGAKNIGKVDMMHQNDFFNYYSTPEWSSLTIPYKGANRMIVILPAENGDIMNVAANFSYDDFVNICSYSERASTDLAMPKFETGGEIACNDILTNLGMSLHAKDLSGIWSGMAEDTSSVINVRQFTKVQNDEKGTVAAGVTTAGLVGADSPEEQQYKKIKFSIDRPFIYLIYNFKTNSIVMAGLYSEPGK